MHKSVWKTQKRNIESVSYTHLDVYKRQAPVRVPIGKDAFGNTEWGWGAPSQVGEVNPAERLFGSGYNKSFRSQIMSQITLKQDLSFLLKGLDIQASFSFDANNQTIQNRRKNSSTYNITGVDDETGEFQVAEITKGNEFLGYNVTPVSYTHL